MIGVPELGASEYTALCDASQPSTRDDDVIDGFFRETIIAVPGPMMDLLARKPGVSDAQVCASAERQEAVAIVVGGSVDECGANNIRPVSAPVPSKNKPRLRLTCAPKLT